MSGRADRLPGAGWSGRARAFVELGELRLVELWLGFLVAVSLLGRSAATRPRALSILGVTLVSTAAVLAATCSLDDVASGRARAGRADRQGGHRRGPQGLDLEGRLPVEPALALVYALCIIAALGYVAAISLAWPLPVWVIVTMACVVVLSIGHSHGPRLSYRGAGELCVFVATAGTVLVPFGLVARSVGWTVVWNAVLFGSWHAQAALFASAHEAEEDRRRGRLTIAARLSRRAHRVYVAAVFTIFWAATAAALSAGVLPIWYVLTLAPVWALQVFQLWRGALRERWLEGRLLGFRVVRLGTIALVTSNFLVFN